MAECVTEGAIREIERLATENKKVKFHTSGIGAEPRDVYYVENPDGELERHVAEKLCQYTLQTPEEFTRFAEAEGDDEKKIVFYNSDHLVFFHDEEARRDAAYCKLTHTEQFVWLRDQCKGFLSQRDMIRLLRITFRGCLSDETNLLTLVRNLKWSTGDDSAGNFQHGKESLGRAIESKVSGDSSIPEETRLSIPVWNEFGYRHLVSVAIEIFPADKTFKLTPFPQELDQAILYGLDEIEELLKTSKQIPKVYRGQA